MFFFDFYIAENDFGGHALDGELARRVYRQEKYLVGLGEGLGETGGEVACAAVRRGWKATVSRRPG